MDRHRILVFYYKIASLYFGSGDFDKSIDYLNKIINWKVDLRTDLQCYARLLHLIAHYELGNFDLLEYLIEIRLPVHVQNAELNVSWKKKYSRSFAIHSVYHPNS
jgi:tetratricopeptide (TPR) repeat protein